MNHAVNTQVVARFRIPLRDPDGRRAADGTRVVSLPSQLLSCLLPRNARYKPVTEPSRSPPSQHTRESHSRSLGYTHVASASAKLGSTVSFDGHANLVQCSLERSHARLDRRRSLRDSDEAKAFIASEIDAWAKVIEAAGVPKQ